MWLSFQEPGEPGSVLVGVTEPELVPLLLFWAPVWVGAGWTRQELAAFGYITERV